MVQIFAIFAIRLFFLRDGSLTIDGEGPVLFQWLEPINFCPSQVKSPKILAPFKRWAQKIVTLQSEKIFIFLGTLFWDNYFTGIRKKCYNLFETVGCFGGKKKAFKKAFHEMAVWNQSLEQC